jgi:hypothetical protein
VLAGRRHVFEGGRDNLDVQQHPDRSPFRLPEQLQQVLKACQRLVGSVGGAKRLEKVPVAVGDLLIDTEASFQIGVLEVQIGF